MALGSYTWHECARDENADLKEFQSIKENPNSLIHGLMFIFCGLYFIIYGILNLIFLKHNFSQFY